MERGPDEFEEYTGIPGNLPGEESVGCWWCITPSSLLYPGQESKAFHSDQLEYLLDNMMRISHCMGLPYFGIRLGKNDGDLNVWNVAIYCIDPNLDNNKELVFQAHRWLVERLEEYTRILVLGSKKPEQLKGKPLFYLIADFNNGNYSHVWPIAF